MIQRTASLIAGVLLFQTATMSATDSVWTVFKAEDLREWNDPGKGWKTENGVFVAEIGDHDATRKSTGAAIAPKYRPYGGLRFEVRNLKLRPAR